MAEPRRPTKYPDAETAVAEWFATLARTAHAAKELRGIEDWFLVLRVLRQQIREHGGDIQARLREFRWSDPPAAKEKCREHVRELKAEADAIERQLHDIRKLPKAERERQLAALFEHYVKHRTDQIVERATGQSAVLPEGAPNWQAARSALETGSSERVVLNLETAFERGQFESSPIADYPIADISGRVGHLHMTAHAELRSDLDTPEARAIMHDLAARLRDPRLGLGPRMQQTVQALMKFWLQSRTKAGFVSVTIQQLAQALGYQRGSHGFHPSHYEQIREFVETAKYASLQVKGLPAQKDGLGAASRLTGAAYNIEYIDDAGAASASPAKGWTAITFRPGSFLTAAASHDGALLMGFDPELNRLNPHNERGVLLLAKYLERHFRFNWNNAPGRIERKVRTLLGDGMGLTDAAIAKPAIETRTALEAALDRLEELGTVKTWQGDANWQTVDAQLEPIGGRRRRMTGSLWHVALEALVTIEAGKLYERHYIEHGLTYQGDDVNPLVRDLREHIAESGRTQAAIAHDLGVNPSQLSKVLSGKRKISPELGGRIETLVRQGKTLPLFDNGGRR